jgi:hypothetical protein
MLSELVELKGVKMPAHVQIRNAILLSIGCSALAVACSEKEDTGDTAASTATDSADPISSMYPEIPTGEYPECTEAASEYQGDCCVDVYCTESVDEECPEAENQNAGMITGLSLGSGDCLCEDVAGPYSSQGAEAYTETTGDCCYLVGVQGCEGRPMMVRDELRKAPLVRGKAWS